MFTVTFPIRDVFINNDDGTTVKNSATAAMLSVG